MKTKIHILTILTIMGISSLARADMSSAVNLPIAYEPPPVYTVDPPPPPVVILGSCGDGTPDYGEECDDGNKINNDGCSNDCHFDLPPPVKYDPPVAEDPPALAPPADTKPPEKTVTPGEDDPSEDTGFIGVGMSGSGALGCTMQALNNGSLGFGYDLGFLVIVGTGVIMFPLRNRSRKS